MIDHLSDAQLEAYVIGALDGAELTTVEAHVMVCRVCEARLQNEARLDMVFTALAHETRPRRTYAAPLAFAGTALAMAAAMIVWVLPHGSTDTERPQSSDPPVLTDTNNGDASTVTASLELQADGSRIGVRD
jgi:anti-sigma factor ChrR (cupin superfamily)